MRRRAWGIISTILVAVILFFAILLVTLKVAGFNLLTVLSGSMEPAYHVGSLIFVKSVDVNTLKENDVITFMADEDTIVTHRIYSVLNEVGDDGSTTLKFRTKGDANTATDASLVDYRNVIGTPVLSIPYLGYLANFI
jgi:signal peptidase